MTQTIAVYAEHCTRSGQRYYRANADDLNNDDVLRLDVTVDEYKRLRRASRKAGAGRDIFLRRCARSVMEALR
jgi:hypothetical protein